MLFVYEWCGDVRWVRVVMSAVIVCFVEALDLACSFVFLFFFLLHALCELLLAQKIWNNNIN